MAQNRKRNDGYSGISWGRHYCKRRTASINEKGILLEDIVEGKHGTSIKQHIHGALEYTRKATQDVNNILHDLTGYGEESGEGDGFRVEDVLKALDEKEKKDQRKLIFMLVTAA